MALHHERCQIAHHCFRHSCYNEQAGLLSYALASVASDLDRLIKSKAVSPRSYVLFVDDGSTDRTHVFLRGLVVQLGFKTATVTYDRLPWLHGETKYTLAKMLALAINGITSMSVRPIRMIALMGIILFVVFAGMSIWVFSIWLAGYTVQGWTSVMLLFLLIASFQTFAIAVIGEYVGKIFFEAKSRPRYIIEREIGIPQRGMSLSLEEIDERERKVAVNTR